MLEVSSATRTPSSAQSALDREEVLLGERLRRRHQRALAAGLDGAQQRVERDGGLPRADVALQEPLHRRRSREVAVDLRDRLLLRLGEREGQHARGSARRARPAAGAARPRAPPARAARRRSASWSVSSSSSASRRRARSASSSRARPVEPDERVRAQRQRVARADVGGQRLADVAGERERRLRQRAEGLLREVRGRRVDGREVRRLHGVADVERPTPGSRTGSACPAGAGGCPGVSFGSSHGWLNHVARISPVASVTCAVRMWSRPRRRADARRTTTSSTASSSPKSSAIVRSSAAVS